MIHFSAFIITEFVLGLFLWWVAIYLITQNPFNRINQLVFGILATISLYFSTDLLLFFVKETHQYVQMVDVLKLFSWCLYLPIAFLYHATLLLIPPKERKSWQKFSVYSVYLFAFVLIIIENATNLIRDYASFALPSFNGDLNQTTGRFFWFLGLLLLSSLFLTALNFWILAQKQIAYSPAWYKFILPFWGIVLSILLSPAVLLGYYRILPYSPAIPIIDLLLIIAPIVYSIIRYKLFVDEIDIIFGKNFRYSTFAIGLVVIIYLLIAFSTAAPSTSFSGLILSFSLSYLVIASHPFYNWLSTFINDLIYNASAGFSVVNDEEVCQAIRNFNCPEKLENSPMLRLKAVDSRTKNNDKFSVDSLRQLLKESIEYFKPEGDSSRRIKRNLKYQILKMIAYDQSEEGQILWELGFEEYPVAIMTRENRERKPLFKIESPSDYFYTSRNAYLALKKEAIHDVTWRISYLEKLSKK